MEIMGNLQRVLLASAAVASLCFILAVDAFAQAVATEALPEASTLPAQSDLADVTRLEEIVVTALKSGAQELQRTPTAISVVSGLQLTDRVVNNVEDLFQSIPNMSFSRTSTHAQIYLRGIGSNNFGAGSDADVTTQIDGVYIARNSGQMTNFLDVDRVEVLRGPQGTLYGRNAVGGTINVISRQPSDVFTGEMSLSGGNFGYGAAKGYVSGPLAENLLGSLAFSFDHDEDYFENIAPGARDVGGGNSGGVRGQLRWEPSSSVDVTVRADASYKDQPNAVDTSHTLAPTAFPSLANGIIDDLSKVSVNFPSPLETRVGGVAVEVNWRFAPNFSLKSISAFRSDSYHNAVDNDQTELSLNHFTSSEHDKAVSQEFNLQYNGDRFASVSGLYFFNDHDEMSNQAVLPAMQATRFGTEYVNSTVGAIFAQGTYYITPDISVVAGGRYTFERKTFNQNLGFLVLGASVPGFPVSFRQSADFNAFTPKFGLNWQVTPDVLLYASATRGYKSGGFNFAASSPATSEFDPETIWSYEVGAKTQWLEDRLRFNVDVFHYRYSDLQVASAVAPGVVAIENAASAKGEGVEVELVAKPAASVRLTANFFTLRAKYVDFPGAVVPAAALAFVPNQTCVPAGSTTCTINASGNYLNNAPATGALVAVDFNHDVGAGFHFSARVAYNWRDRTYFDPSNETILSQAAYGLLDAQLALDSPDSTWRVQLFGNNLTNEAYAVYVLANGFVPAALIGKPRTYGIQISRYW